MSDEMFRAAVMRERQWVAHELQGVMQRARARAGALEAQGRAQEAQAALRAHVGGIVAVGRLLPIGYPPEVRLGIELEAGDVLSGTRVERESPIVLAPAGAVRGC